MNNDDLTPIIKGYYEEINNENGFIDEWVPEDDSEVIFRLTLEIGPAGHVGADLYDVLVVTPVSINKHNLGRRLAQEKAIVVSPYSWANVIQEIENILSLCEGETYNERTAILCERFNWEGDY